jgi:hypothetical protein
MLLRLKVIIIYYFIFHALVTVFLHGLTHFRCCHSCIFFLFVALSFPKDFLRTSVALFKVNFRSSDLGHTCKCVESLF